jgi:hypothetical protein
MYYFWCLSNVQFDFWLYDLNYDHALAYQIWFLSSKGFSKYWIDIISLDLLTSKAIGVIYSLGCMYTAGFCWFSSEMFSRHWVDQCGLTFDLLTWKSYSIVTNPTMKCNYNQVNGSHDIEQTACGLATDRQTDRPTGAKQYAPLRQKEDKETKELHFKSTYLHRKLHAKTQNMIVQSFLKWSIDK